VGTGGLFDLTENGGSNKTEEYYRLMSYNHQEFKGGASL